MGDGFLAFDLLVLQERVRRVERIIERRHLRDAQNLFDIPRDEFMDLYRISPELAMQLTDQLRPFLQRQRITGIAPERQILAAVNFYATGSYQRPVGGHINLSQPVISRCIRTVTRLINERLLRRWVQFPMTEADRQAARMKFANAPQPFEGAIGAIDCTYVKILGPPNHEEAYVNHHGDHCLNVQTICDPDLKILNINARFPGARHDAYIWRTSPIRRAMEFHYNRGERQTWLIGDAGYPLEPWLMTPLPHYEQQTRQFQYNEQLCKARNVVERLFGVLKGTWRCLSYQRVLMYDPGMAGQIVNACAVLHNMRIHHRLPIIENLDPNIARAEANEENGAENAEDEVRRGPRAIAERIQRQIMQTRFGNFRCAWA